MATSTTSSSSSSTTTHQYQYNNNQSNAFKALMAAATSLHQQENQENYSPRVNLNINNNNNIINKQPTSSSLSSIAAPTLQPTSQQQQQQQPTSSLITKSMVIRPSIPPHSAPTSTMATQPIQPSQPVQQHHHDPNVNIIVREPIKTSQGIIYKEYHQGEFLGKGGFARCYTMTDLETKRVYAAKIVPKSALQKPRPRSKLKSEIRIHCSLNHDNIVKFEHCFETDENVYILLGLCNQMVSD
ncbi:hypothetical protein SAMD00019534_032350 [Acytostelium subglobosum LB1]|uniref:hypothetical protein n=1 Tax=Acytostelium subglobosum LB1 TaxID=1410327 RepID=UPI000644B65A|nr:hypothetical protein SAMD00019534_032350 [Acytostelium subglobosum LB1]GAM20060.1 hypothetical protein SAMD00019534_032350 [Acytostelium subglobosum LB1]|eukprot:XP_012756822.1 hypothetical protein SAMD00019534_032350 [Acytostelium subglobosum LB1]